MELSFAIPAMPATTLMSVFYCQLSNFTYALEYHVQTLLKIVNETIFTVHHIIFSMQF